MATQAIVKMGSIRKRTDCGSWEATYTKDGRRIRVAAPTKEDVLNRVHEAIVKAGARVDDAPTLRFYAAQWLERAHILPRTAAHYKDLLQRHIFPFQTDAGTMGEMRLTEIKVRHVRALLDEKRKTLSPDSVRLIKASLSSCLTDAVADELIPQNVCLLVSTRKRGGVRKEHKQRTMTREQLDAFVEVAKGEGVAGLMFVVMARTGCRPSESRALQVRDIDFPRGIIRINRVNPVHGEERTGSKTGRSRQIDMTPELASLLRAHIDSIPGAAFKKDIPLFISEAGTSIDWSNAIRVFERICRKAKITPEGQDCPFSPYCLRHSVASVLLAERAELTYVSNLLGHADCATTLRFYAHHIPSNGERYVDRLDHAKIVKER